MAEIFPARAQRVTVFGLTLEHCGDLRRRQQGLRARTRFHRHSLLSLSLRSSPIGVGAARGPDLTGATTRLPVCESCHKVTPVSGGIAHRDQCPRDGI